MKWVPFGLFVVVCAVFAFSMSLEKKPPSALVGKPFPEFDLGGKPTLVNIFASWCLPCLDEHPRLLAIKKQYPEIEILGVAWKDSQENIDTFLTTHGNPYTRVHVDERGLLTAALGITGVPETYVVANDAVVVDKISMPITDEMLAGSLGKTLERLNSP